MAIREAVLDDIPHLVVMGLHFIRSYSSAGLIDENPDAIFDMMLSLVDSDQAVVFVAETEKPIGMLGAHLVYHPMSSEFIATELFWWVEPGHRGNGIRLMRAFEDWARDKGAQKLHMTAPNEKTGRVYVSAGFRKLEESYQKDL